MNHQKMMLLLIILVNDNADNSSSFKYKIKLLGNVTEVAGNAAGVRRLNE